MLKNYDNIGNRYIKIVDTVVFSQVFDARGLFIFFDTLGPFFYIRPYKKHNSFLTL